MNSHYRSVYTLENIPDGREVVAVFASLDALYLYLAEDYDVDLDELLADPEAFYKEHELRVDTCHYYE